MLSVVMVLSMSVSVFAADATPISVTVNFAAIGSTPDVPVTDDFYEGTTTVSAYSGDSIESIVRTAIAQKGLSAVWKTVNDFYNPALTHQALESITADSATYATWIAADYSEGAGWTWEAYLTDGTNIPNDNYMCCRYMGGNGTIDLMYTYEDYTSYE